MLAISRLNRFCIAYYNDTADLAKQATMDRRKANGGLGGYYSQADTRTPTWLIVGDTRRVGETTGLNEAALHGGDADTETARIWLDDGHTPSGAHGLAFNEKSVHGFDLTFAAPKSVSLIRALTDDISEKVLAVAHARAVEAAMTYLHRHAGYTRVLNVITGTRDLHRLPGLVAIAYPHETSRCGDPHLHTHVIVPNRQPRADGRMISLHSKSLYYEVKAAGTIYQATLRHLLHAEGGFEWQPVDPRTGMADIAGVARETIRAWSRRSTQLRAWARDKLVLRDGRATAAQLEAAQRATRPPKLESLTWAELKEQWLGDERGLRLDREAHYAARAARRAARSAPMQGAHLAAVAAQIGKAAFTRAGLVQLISTQLPVDVAGEPRVLIERAVDAVGVRITAPRAAHELEGHERFTLTAILAEEERIFDAMDACDNRARLDARAVDLAELSGDQRRAMSAIAVSPFLVQPLQVPAGAGKTHSLKSLRAAAHRARKQVLVLAPTGEAVDEAMSSGAGDHGLTFAKALKLIADGQLALGRSTLVVVDEAAMFGTPELGTLLFAAVAGRAKVVLVGDAYQLSPLNARGGMFEQLCIELPWSQHLSEVRGIRDPQERGMSLALRSARGHRLRSAVNWYRTQGRLHVGGPVAMAADALNAYVADRANRKDALLVCDTSEMADALNRRLHDALTVPGPSVRAARDQHIRAGDVITSRTNDATIALRPGAPHAPTAGVDQVRDGDRWRVAAIDTDTNRLAAERLTDGARTVFGGTYLIEHVSLGYAATVHAAHDVSADVCHALLGEHASRAMLYVAMTRGRHHNQAYLYQKLSHDADHDLATPVAAPQMRQLHRGDKYCAARTFRAILANDGRPAIMHAIAERTAAEQLPDVVADALARNQRRRGVREATWTAHVKTVEAWRRGYDRMAAASARAADISLDVGGLEL
jgi:conjugative relaxase-like TrwC/TraI family protein